MDQITSWAFTHVNKRKGFFMTLADYIDAGTKKAGSLTALGRLLEISQPDMSKAKAMKNRIPTKAAVQLAEYIGADLKAVIAANELVTEKDERKRAFWNPFVEHARAASIALTLGLVTSFVTPSPAEATPLQKVGEERLCIMSNRKSKRHSKQRQLTGAVQMFIKSSIEALQSIFPRRVTQV